MKRHLILRNTLRTLLFVFLGTCAVAPAFSQQYFEGSSQGQGIFGEPHDPNAAFASPIEILPEPPRPEPIFPPASPNLMPQYAPPNAASVADPRMSPPAPLRGGVNRENDMILDVKVNGHGQIPLEKIREKVKARSNRPFDEMIIEEDKRNLMQTGWFYDVTPTTYRKHDGVIIVYNLLERPLLHYVKFVGNRAYPRKKLQEIAMISPGDQIDPMIVHQAKSRIEEFYRQDGHHKIHVEILSGDRITDRGAVFLISEGGKQKIDRVQIVGGKQIGAARLKAIVKSKPGWFYFIGGEFTREKLDEDVEMLTDYYRNLGFFFAKIDREFEESRGYLGFGEEDCWVTVRFIVDEGPQCTVTKVTLQGNNKYSDEEILAEMKKIQIGKPFNGDSLQADILKIKDLYGRQGRVFTEVNEDYIVEYPSPNKGTVELVINIRESKQFHYDSVEVDIYDQAGGRDSYTKLRTILNRTNSVRPGMLINTAKIREDERRLRAAGLFIANPAQGYLPEVILERDERNFAECFEDSVSIDEAYGITRGQADKRPAQQKQRQQQRLESAGYTVPYSAAPNVKAQHKPDPQAFQRNINSMIREEVQSVERKIQAEERQREQRPQPQQQGKRPYFSPEDGEIPIYRGQAGRAIPSLPSNTVNNAASTSATPFTPSTGAYPYDSEEQNQNYGSFRSNTGASESAYASPFTGGAAPVAAAPTPTVTENYGSYGGLGQTNPETPVPTGGLYGNGNNYGNATSPYGNGNYGDASGAVARGGLFSPQPYHRGPNNPSTQGGGIMDPVFPGSAALEDHWNANFNPKPQPIMTTSARVRVQEAQTGQLQMSVGVNSDSGVIATFQYKEDNFDWRRPPRNPFRFEDWRNAFRGNGERFRIVAQPGTKVQRYEASWENPYFLDTDWSFGMSASYYSRYYSEWRERRLGGTLSLGYRLTPDLLFQTYYKGENVRVYDPVYAGIPDLDDALGDNPMHTFGIKLAHDTRDNQHLSTEGHLASFTAEQVLGEYQYPRLSVDLRQYFMLNERHDSSGRWVLGLRSAASWSGDDTPIFERYYAGGFTTIRGFEYRGVSPRYDWVPVGGNFEFYNSAELLFPITADDMIRGVVFVDTGCVQSRINDWKQEYRVAPGFGVRITIPMLGQAPIAFDFAFPVHKDPSDDTTMFSFYVGFMR